MDTGTLIRRGLMIAFGLAIVVVGLLRIKTSQPTLYPVLAPVENFNLTDEQGQPFNLAMLKGKVWAANFIFTTCPGPCMTTTKWMARLQERVGARKDLRLVSFSVDPQLDTPPILKAYAEKYGAKPGHWFFATGGIGVIRTLARDSFKLAVEDGDQDMRYIHSTRVGLVDRKGRVRAYFDGMTLDTIPATAQALEDLLSEK